MIEEEFQRDKATMKGSSKKPKSEGTPNHQEQGKGNQGKQGGRANQRNGQGKTSTQTLNPSSDKTNAGSNSQKSDKTAKNKQKDFSQLTKYWDSYKDAYQGVSWDETNKHKEMERIVAGAAIMATALSIAVPARPLAVPSSPHIQARRRRQP